MASINALPAKKESRIRRTAAFLGILLALACGIAVAKFGCTSTESNRLAATTPSSELLPPAPDALQAGARISFRDLAKSAGIKFKHVDSPSDMQYVPEIMGGGAAWIDYDQDGYVDLFLVQGGKFPTDPNEKRAGPASRLYRNMGDGTFVDVTEKAGIWHPSFGQGVAVGDYDNDGFPDLFVACYGHCHLYHNEPDGHGGRRFREVSKEAGVEMDGWCSACAFGDIHGTGYLDLFVCRYVIMDLEHYPGCFHNGPGGAKVRISCGPKEFEGNQCALFKNNGNGTFTNVSQTCCVDKDGKTTGLEPKSKGLGVLILDFDDDGIMDIFVGNDENPNHYYRGLGKGKLQSMGYLCGNATNGTGNPLASMGLEAGDLCGNGRADIFITTFYNEGTALFRNEGTVKGANLMFADVSQQDGMYHASFNNVGWGSCLLDVRRNGLLDIFVVNGHVYRNAEQLNKRMPNGELHKYRQKAQLFLGDGKGHFHIVQDAGPYFEEGHVGRGVAMGDYDNDGHMDIAINNCGEDAVLLHNETQTPNHWIRLVLEGSRHLNPAGSNRDAVGAKVTLTVDGKKRVRYVRGGGSYYSVHDRRLLVGLGAATQVDEVEVRWPNRDASTQRFGPLQADQSYKLVEGAAAAVPAHCPPIKQ